ncbi:hypothetical protein JKP88DRAFT_315677 [Tribonema minus]|uniref:Uncharacterized protein n=1 Tax=Tribonema minus TaxID=303371 RepID=A0A836CHN9_9STRA|nr:hypothetical protein JKP88DRAFT_315677 [Tribonema minus]
MRQAQDSYAILQHVYLTIAYTMYRRCRNALRQRTGNTDGRIQVQDIDATALHFSDILPAVQQPHVTPKRCDFAGAPPYPSCVHVPSATFQRLIHTMRVHLHHGTSKSKGAMNLMHMFTERLFVKFISHMVRTFLHYANRKVIRRRDVVYSLTAFEAFRKLHDLPRRLPASWFQGEIDEDYEPSSSSSDSDDGSTSSSDSSSDDEGGGGNVTPIPPAIPPVLHSSSSEEEGPQDLSGDGHLPLAPPPVSPTQSNFTAEEEEEEEQYLGGGGDYVPSEEQAEEHKEEEQDFGGGNDYSPPPHTPPPPPPQQLPPPTPPQPRPAAQRRQRTPRRLDLAPVLLHPRTRRPPTHLADFEQHLDMRTVSRILPANRRVVRIEHTQDNALRAFVAAYNHTPPTPRPRLTMRAVPDLLLINPVTTGGNRDRRDFATLAQELNIRLIIVGANGEESIAYGQAGGKTVFIERTQHYDPIYLIDTPERRAGRTSVTTPPAYVPRSASDLRQHADRNNGETQTLATLRRLRTAPAAASAMRRLQQVVRRTPVSSGHDTSPALPRVFPPRQREHTHNSWLYMPVILGALQTGPAPDTASAVVNAAVRIYRAVFQANSVTLAMVRDRLDDDRHMSAELQEALLGLSPPHANALALYALSTFRSSDELRG